MHTEVRLSHSARLRRAVRQLHRWLGLLIALQLLFWISGGLVMSALRLPAVRGEDAVSKTPPPALQAQDVRLPISELLQAHEGAAITAITLGTWLGRPVYRVTTGDGIELIDAGSGRRLSPLPAADAQSVARADYRGPGRAMAPEWIETPALEYRGRELPLWRVRFDDARHTTLYVSPQTGEVVARRNDLWRAFDFVWMLHIMDYDEREDFNHPLLIATAATALLFVLSGLGMLGYSFIACSWRHRGPR